MTIYYHRHHIIPRHSGGTNDPSNIITLTVEEHAEAHKKLWEEHGLWQDKLAWMSLSGQIGKEEIQKEICRQTGLNNKGKTNINGSGNKGKTKTELHKINISKAHKGIKKTWLKGNQYSAGKRTIPIECPHCKLIGYGKNNMNRYHFYNCKEAKTNERLS
jgi:hypothetical protein